MIDEDFSIESHGLGVPPWIGLRKDLYMYNFTIQFQGCRMRLQNVAVLNPIFIIYYRVLDEMTRHFTPFAAIPGRYLLARDSRGQWGSPSDYSPAPVVGWLPF